MMRLLVPFFIFLTLSSVVFAQDFSINDELASASASNIIDPEYNATINMVCWISPESQLWVCSLDPSTHKYIPSDGKGILIADSLRPFEPGGWNGPEWMLSAANTQIAYNKVVNGICYPAIATMGLLQWPSTILPYAGCVYVMATHNYYDADAMMLFETNDNSGIKWLSTANLNQLYQHTGSTLGFFAETGGQICAIQKNSERPGFIETNSLVPYFRPVSDDTAAAPFMWNDPETGKRLFMFRTDRGKKLKIFIEEEPNKWWPYNHFCSPAPPPYDYINSPEPFVFGGKSYISFAASTSSTGNQMPPAQVWLAAVNPDEPLFRKISDPSIATCVDPEPVVFGNEAYVYYSEKLMLDNGNYMLRVRKCETGLVAPNTGISLSKEAPHLGIFPNPTSGIFQIETQRPAESCTLEISNFSGQEIYRDENVQGTISLDASTFQAGTYLVRLITKDGTAASKFVVLH